MSRVGSCIECFVKTMYIMHCKSSQIKNMLYSVLFTPSQRTLEHSCQLNIRIWVTLLTDIDVTSLVLEDHIVFYWNVSTINHSLHDERWSLVCWVKGDATWNSRYGKLDSQSETITIKCDIGMLSICIKSTKGNSARG